MIFLGFLYAYAMNKSVYVFSNFICVCNDGILPLHHGDGEDVVGGDGDHAGSAPPEFSPPICRSRSLFRGFSVYGRLLVIYVGGLFL